MTDPGLGLVGLCLCRAPLEEAGAVYTVCQQAGYLGNGGGQLACHATMRYLIQGASIVKVGTKLRSFLLFLEEELVICPRLRVKNCTRVLALEKCLVALVQGKVVDGPCPSLAQFVCCQQANLRFAHMVAVTCVSALQQRSIRPAAITSRAQTLSACHG